MSDNRIDIEIHDSISPNISAKIQGIAKSARDADSAILKLKAQLASLNNSALGQLQQAVNSATSAFNQNALANQRLATEMQRTAAAASNAQAAQTRVNAAQTQAAAAAQQLASATSRAAAAQHQTAAAAQRLATEQQRTAAATSQAQAAADRAALSSLRLQQAQDRVAQSASGAARGVLTFVQSAAALVGVGLSAQAILESADAYTTLQNKLKNVAESEKALAVITEEVFAVANRTRTGVQETAQAFTRFDMAMKGLGASQSESLRLTETINKSLIVSGATSSEASSGLLQLSQAFNKGKLDGDEFRSVMETMPIAADAIAKQLKVVTGDLLRLAPEGKITADVMRKAFAAVATEIDAKFAKTVPTIGQAMTVLKNNAIQTFGEIDKALGVTASISNAVLFVAKNMKFAAVAVAALGTALAVAFGPALVGLLAAATSAVWTFTFAIAANPIGALVVGITTAIAAISLFGDEIKLTADGLVTLKDTALAIWSLISEGFGFLVVFMKEVWNSGIDFISSKTDGWGEKFRDIGLFVLDFAKIAVNSYIGLWAGAYNAIVSGWNRFPAALYDIFAKALNGVVSITENIVNGVLEGINKIASIANQGADALGLDKIFDGDFSFSLDEYKKEVGSTASELADTFKSSFADAFNTDFLGNAVSAIDARARQISATRRQNTTSQTELRGEGRSNPIVDPKAQKAIEKRADAIAKVSRSLDEELTSLQRIGPEYVVLNQLLEIENSLLDKKIKLSESERGAFRLKLKDIQEQKASNALAEINKELSQQSELLGKIGPQQSIAQQMQQYENDLRQKGIVLSQQERAELQSKLKVLQQQNFINQEVNKIYNETQGFQLSLQNQAIALNQAYQKGLLTLDQYSQRLAKLSVDMANLKLQMGDGTFADFAAVSLGSIVTQYEGVLSGLANSFGSFFQNFADGFANSVGKAVVYSENLGVALNNVAKEAIGSLISALVKLGIQWTVNAALGQSIGAASLASQTAMSTAAAAAVAAAWAPAAAMVSLASFGANSAGAMAGITATNALSESLALASMAGFKQGGYTGDIGTAEIAGVVHGREFVMTAEATARNRPMLEAMNRGASAVAVHSSAVGSATGVSLNVTIENYGVSKNFEVQLNENDVRIIARDEARETVRKETPNVVASEIRNPNSRVSQSLSRNTKTERMR